MSRVKTIAFFAWAGPAVGAVPIFVAFLTLAVFEPDAREAGMVVAALLMVCLYGLIPSVVAGWLFSWLAVRRPGLVDQAASVAAAGASAGFLATLPLAVWALRVTEKVLAWDPVLVAAAFLVHGTLSGAVCAILWRRRDRKTSGIARERTAPLLGFLSLLFPTSAVSTDAAAGYGNVITSPGHAPLVERLHGMSGDEFDPTGTVVNDSH